MVVVDVSHVFRMFGGPKGLLDALTYYQPDHGLSYNAVQMWSQRTTIPARWLGLVLYIIAQKGWQFAEFLTDDAEFG
jgi:hypothetical protein